MKELEICLHRLINGTSSKKKKVKKVDSLSLLEKTFMSVFTESDLIRHAELLMMPKVL